MILFSVEVLPECFCISPKGKHTCFREPLSLPCPGLSFLSREHPYKLYSCSFLSDIQQLRHLRWGPGRFFKGLEVSPCQPTSQPVCAFKTPQHRPVKGYCNKKTTGNTVLADGAETQRARPEYIHELLDFLNWT